MHRRRTKGPSLFFSVVFFFSKSLSIDRVVKSSVINDRETNQRFGLRERKNNEKKRKVKSKLLERSLNRDGKETSVRIRYTGRERLSQTT